MDNNIFEQFNTMFDLEGLKEDIAKSDAPMEFVEVPHGMYEVSVASMELGVSKSSNKPMMKVRFKILNGEFAGQSIFMNQMLTSGFGIHNCNLFLESTKTNVEVEFKDFVQYSEVINDVFDDLTADSAEFALNYYEEKGWNRFEITERF